MLYKKGEQSIEYQKFTLDDYLPFKHEGLETIAIHEGHPPEPIHGSINVPIHMSTTYAQKDINDPFGKFDYTRGGNPTREALESCLGGIQYGKYCTVFASGSGGTAAVMHTLKSGDHVVICDDVYRGMQRYMKLFSDNNYGIEADFVDMTKVENVEKAIKANTKLVWVESPSNPTIKLIDIHAITTLAKKHNIISVVDNTLPTPVLQSPILLGADIVYHSCTKYLGGHSDVVMGAIVTNHQHLHEKIYLASCSMGVNPSPFDCFLMSRGLKTLAVRVERATKNAYHLAHFLEKSEHVVEVRYPGLKSHPQHDIAKKQMRGFGGMLSFRIKGGREQVSKFLKAAKIFTLAQSLGGVESLIHSPAFMTHSTVPEKRAQLGITDNLIRVSVGIQETYDLIVDVDQALKASQL